MIKKVLLKESVFSIFIVLGLTVLFVVVTDDYKDFWRILRWLTFSVGVYSVIATFVLVNRLDRKRRRRDMFRGHRLMVTK